jgi:NhaP-type Na+/H+ or K+/H+ antiporter
MSADAILVVGAGALFVVATLSGRLEKIWVSEPMLATFLGVVLGFFVIDSISMESPLVLTVLEVTLALVLFSDASRIDVSHLRGGYSWPLRMLLIGLPLVVVLGALFAGWYLGLSFGLALLVGVVLAPTDAALAEPVLESELVQARVRQAINVESGLNDGLAVPLLLIAVGLVGSEEGVMGGGAAAALVLRQLGIGIAGGVFLGWLGARVIGKGVEFGWMNPLHQKMAALALAVSGFGAVQLLGGSGFVATFIAGGLMGHLIRPRPEYLYDFAEIEGHSLVLVAFFVIGAGITVDVLREGVSMEAVVMALVSLFILRPLAIWLSLLGQKLKRRTILFLGWFGPRGLATVVFTLVAVEELGVLDPLVQETLTVAVLLSILLHGVTAIPMARWLAGMPMADDMPEMGEVFPHPMRRI